MSNDQMTRSSSKDDLKGRKSGEICMKFRLQFITWIARITVSQCEYTLKMKISSLIKRKDGGNDRRNGVKTRACEPHEEQISSTTIATGEAIH
ncbi:hypothetical protein AB6A40_001742 [Gnathostoma spinigerum]|uniref:Uncharacterized protein n=1 Tax=Gnathostoma spinigerum TaxID=75299 RepID=A0ABD6E509_9BILA